MLTQFISDLKGEFSGYGSKSLGKDLMAGVTVAAVALPLALAFGVGSGADAAAGLITAIIAGVLIGALSGASFQISGPTGAMMAILISLVNQYGLSGIFAACVIAGIILLAAGLLRCGNLMKFVPAPVITGFTSGIAIIIALGQLDNFFGVKSTGESAIQRLGSYFTQGFAPNLYSVGIGLFVILLMVFWPKKLGKRLPGSLAALIIVLIVNSFLDLPVSVVGEIPKTLLPENRLTLSTFPLENIGALIAPGISIAVLGMVESLMCGACAGRMKGEKLNADRELVAQGIGNIVLPFFGGIPATAAIARTSVAIKSGQRTRLTSIFHSLFLLASMFVLGPVMSRIPMAALAGVLLVTSWRMNEWESIRFVFSHKLKGAMAKFFITMAATVLLDLTWAIIIGVIFSAFIFISRISDIEINVSDVDPERMGDEGLNLRQHQGHIKVMYLTGTIFFATIEKIESQMARFADSKVIILSMRGVPAIDTSAIQALTEMTREVKDKGIVLMFCGVQNKVKTMLERGGITDIAGEDMFFWSADRAILEAQNLALKTGSFSHCQK